MAHLLEIIRTCAFGGRLKVLVGFIHAASRVRSVRDLFRFVLILIAILCCCKAYANSDQAPPKPPKPKPAALHISGYGFLGNRELKRILRTLELAGKKPEFFSSSFIEDSALILAARVKRDGYLRPEIDVLLTLTDGAQMETSVRGLLEHPLPRQQRFVSVHFRINKGVLYYFKDLQFEGLQTVPIKTARSYFVETEPLFSTKGSRAYTPERLQRGISSLTDNLDRQGYRDAKVDASDVQQDDRTGAVTVPITVQQGLKYIIRSIREEFQGSSSNQNRTLTLNRPYSRVWLQDFTLGIKTNLYHQGYPDTTVELHTLPPTTSEGETQKDLVAIVKTGPLVRIGAVNFLGATNTSRRLIKRSVRIQRGELLDPTLVEEGRYRLARLGVFDSVDLHYEPEDEHTRDITFALREGKRINLSLLVGWGSYELLRGGVVVEANNLWGEAHHLELKAVQSFKASSGDLVYTVPELVGPDIDLFVNGSGLRRQEIDFTRLEYGGSIGLHKNFVASSTDVTARYGYQILDASDFSSVQEVASVGLTNPAVGSITLDMKHDRRDNPLYPRSGYKVFVTLETATTYLGGDANYQRIEVASSWHHPLGAGLTLSLGLSQGVDASFGSPANNLPFNKRFFPGGQNSIRGYQEGEASPRNEFGQIVGAETYTLGTIELEQALTEKWSLVVFSDNLGFALNLNHYPFDTGLFSVGGGIRWRTLIGPIRLEYGYNLNPRSFDPVGTLQFSLGFPF